MLKVALIGYGKWGGNYIKAVTETGLGFVTRILTKHRIFFRESPTEDFKTVCVDEKNHKEIVRRWYLVEQSAKVAVVATHPPVTEYYALMLLELGMSVMVEKPYTLSMDVIIKTSKLLARNGKLVFLINHQHLFSKAADHIIKYISSTDHIVFSSKAGGQGPRRAYPPMWDYGPHDLALLLYFSQRNFRVIDSLCTVTDMGSIERLVLRSDTGDKADISVWNHKPPKTHRVEIQTPVHTIVYDDLNPESRVKVNNAISKIDYAPPLTLSVTAFLSQVVCGEGNGDPRFGTVLAESYMNLLIPTVTIGV